MIPRRIIRKKWEKHQMQRAQMDFLEMDKLDMQLKTLKNRQEVVRIRARQCAIEDRLVFRWKVCSLMEEEVF